MAHIAPKDLCLSDDDRRGILKNEFGTDSSKNLTDAELEGLLAFYTAKGWLLRPRAGRVEPQVSALRQRAISIAADRGLSPARFRGLCRSICKADQVEWVSDVRRLKRFVAVLERV